MTDGAAGLLDLAGGVVLEVSSQSFAVRAVMGSLVAALLAATAVRIGCVRSRRVRRGLVLAPLAVAAAAGVASAGDAFLPPLMVATSNGVGEQVEVFGHRYTVIKLAWLLIAYVAIASFLLLRRAVGHLAIHAYVRRATDYDHPELVALTRRLSTKLGITAPPLLAVADCPGGAFTSGVRRPVVCVDPELVEQLDDREIEGLIAHELAHIARHDVPLNVGIGIIRDLTFFVAPLHWAARWLRREQEHAADDLASESTGRPAALASSILKVWEKAARRGRVLSTSMACATMVPAAMPVPAGVPTRLLRQSGLRGPAKAIATRVVRLIEGEERASSTRERLEMIVLAVLLGALAALTVVLPARMAESSLQVGLWHRPASAPVEAPAMATFRALSEPAPNALSAAVAVSAPSTPCQDCLVPETMADWRLGQAPEAPARTTNWAGNDGFVWEDPTTPLSQARRAEPLWGVDSRSTRVGVFVVR